MPSNRKQTTGSRGNPRGEAPVAAEERLLTPVLPAALSRETLAWLLLGFFALFVLGFYLVRIPGTSEGNPLTFDRAVFSSLSAVTLTGLQSVSASPFADGSSVLMPVTLLVLTLGGSYLTLLATALPACRVLGMAHPPGRIAGAAGILVLGGTLLGAVVLLTGDPRGWGDGGARLDALVQAASAVGNSGVYWGTPPRVDAWTTHFAILPLAILGGIGLPVLLDLYDLAAGRTPALARHTRLVLTLTAGAYLAGVVLILASNEHFWSVLLGGFDSWHVSGETFGWTPTQGRALRGMVVTASTLAVESRSAGFPSVDLAVLPRATNFVIVLLMAVGASPAGTAGGLKTTTLYVLGRGLRQGMNGDRPAPVVGFALTWVTAFAGIVFVGYAGLLWAAPEVPSDRLLTAAVSATANCGLAHDALSVVRALLFFLGLMMALGRVVPILLLWRMAERLDYADTIAG